MATNINNPQLPRQAPAPIQFPRTVDPGRRYAGSRAVLTPPSDVAQYSGVARFLQHAEPKILFKLANEDDSPNQLIESMCKMISETEDYMECATFIVSILAYYFPGYRTLLTESMESAGFTCEWRNFPDDFTALGYETSLLFDNIHISSLFMFQIVILLFKNISPISYENFIDSRIRALKSHLALPQETTFRLTDGRSAGVRRFSQEVALRISNGAGKIMKLRQTVIRALQGGAVSYRGTIFESAISYVLSILAWTDMALIQFINDMLILPSSPALKHPLLLSELINLHEAFLAIDNFEYPQFFRILAPPQEQEKVMRNKFPNFAALAQTLKARQQNSVSQFAYPGASPELVNQLLTMHDQGVTDMRANPRGALAAQYLLALSDDPLTQEPAA